MTTFYVGKGKNKRAYDNNRNEYHDRIINKHEYAVVIVKDNLTNEEAYSLERDLIEEYVFELGYGIAIKGFDRHSDMGVLTNECWGGTGNNGFIMSDKTKLKISNAQKGKIISKETKEKISESNKGKIVSVETKRKMSESKKSKNLSKETIKKYSEWQKGKNNNQAKPIICITTNKTFETIISASKFYKIKRDFIRDCCNNKRKSAGKLKDGTPLVWKFL